MDVQDVASAAEDRPAGDLRLRVGGSAAIGAGVAGLLGLLSVIPWPELFSIDANPGNALVIDPTLKVVLVGHYAILVVGAALGVVAAVVLAVAVAKARMFRVASVMLGIACVGLVGASGVRAVDLAVNDGRAAQDVEWVVWVAGSMLLVAVALVTLALLEQAGTGFLVLGLGTPVLVAAAIVAFMVLGPDVYPEIWGVTFPPPSDYLLAIWFIGLGRLMRDRLS